MANEGSVRKNIYEFIQAISKLKIEYHKVSINRWSLSGSNPRPHEWKLFHFPKIRLSLF